MRGASLARRLAASAIVFSTITLAESPAFTAVDAEAYDTGSFGNYPHNIFKTTTFRSPRVLLRHWETSCSADDDLYYFLAPYGSEVKHSGPVILDSRGSLVWHNEEDASRHSHGLAVQQYRGENVMTWWTGDDDIQGHGAGTYYMFDNTYKQVKKLGAHNGRPTDFHEFVITSDNTALISSYVRTSFDLTPWGRADGYIWDSYFQEYSIATNKLLFEWQASDHLELDSVMKPLNIQEDGLDGNGTIDSPWNVYRINSVDKDAMGNYLVSLGTFSSLIYVNGRSGQIEWHIGGPYNDFRDLSKGEALDFAGQHHARWTDDYTAITLFDNHVRRITSESEPSRGLKLAVDKRRRTVSVIHSIVHPLNVTGISQGSMQTLDNGNYLLSYGDAPVVTEFMPNGSVVCDLSFGALHTTSSYPSESYRGFKTKWKGIPYQDPRIVTDRTNNIIYVSWNGATEVRSWQIQTKENNLAWGNTVRFAKTGFETNAPISLNGNDEYRLVALDKHNGLIRSWTFTAGGTVQAEIISPKHIRFTLHRFENIFLSFLFMLFALTASRFVYARYLSVRRSWMLTVHGDDWEPTLKHFSFRKWR